VIGLPGPRPRREVPPVAGSQVGGHPSASTGRTGRRRGRSGGGARSSPLRRGSRSATLPGPG